MNAAPKPNHQQKTHHVYATSAVFACRGAGDTSALTEEGTKLSDQPRAEAEAWRKRQPLTGADISDFIALQRICALSDAQVLQVGNEFLQDERPLLPFVADSVRGLIEVGHATLGKADPESHHIRPVVVTVSGRERYEQLCDKQGIPLIIPGQIG